MTSQPIPHLCGGILFNLLLEAKKSKISSREKMWGITDTCSTARLFAGLAEVVTGENTMDPESDSIKKSISLYKTCEKSSAAYIPFINPAIQVVFNNEYDKKKSAILKRSADFSDTYLSHAKCTWLVYALIWTMQHDTAIPKDTEFEIDLEKLIPLSSLLEAKTIRFPVFLGSVLHYVINHCPECESGKATFQAWYSQNGLKNPWKLKETIKSTIGSPVGDITILMDLTTPDAAASEIESTDEANDVYESEIVDSPESSTNKNPTSITIIQHQTNIAHSETKTFNISNSTITFNE